MPTRDLEATLAKIEKVLKGFFPKHQNETFYSLRIDANSVGMYSEEKFAETKAKYVAKWTAEHQPLDLAKLKGLDAETLEDDYYAVHRLVAGSKKRPPVSLEEAVKVVNAERAEELTQGCPYDQPASEEYDSIRHKGSGYGELVELGLGKEYARHYDMGDEEQRTSPYAKAVAEIIAAIAADKKRFFAGAKLSSDFRIHSVEHGY